MTQKKRQPKTYARALGKALENLEYKYKPHATNLELGEAAGHTGATWRNWKLGLGFRPNEQETACKVLGCDIDELIQETRRLLGKRGHRTHDRIMEIAKRVEEISETIKQKTGAQKCVKCGGTSFTECRCCTSCGFCATHGIYRC